MDDNSRVSRDSQYSYDSYQRTSDSRHRRDKPSTNRNRNYDRTRRSDRDRRRSRSRSPPRRRDRDRDGRHDDGSGRRSGDKGSDVHVPFPDRYHEDYSYQREGASRLERSDDRQRPEQDWRLKLTNIRDAHFNRSKQAPSPSVSQNQFTNDGSFLEKFKQMAGQNASCSNVMPNSLALASSSIQFDSEISLPPLTTLTAQEPQTPSTSKEDKEDLDGVPIKKPIPVPVPVSIGRRRTAKPLKTGVVFKKTQLSEEDEASEEKLDAWSKYLNAVQKYKRDNCTEDDATRPLVK